MAGVNGSPSSVQALRRAAEEARMRDALLVPVYAWVPPTGLVGDGFCPIPEPDVTEQDLSWEPLWETFDAAFPGTPWTGDVEPVVALGRAQDVLLWIADRPDDLLVVGAGRRGTLSRLRRGQTARHCVARASCAVLVVPAGAAGPPDGQRAVRRRAGWVSGSRAAPPGR